MHTRLHEFENLYRRVLNEINEEDRKNLYLLRLFNDLVTALSEASLLHFNTLFARVSFITSRYQFDKAWSYAMQIIRRELKQREIPDAELFPILTATLQYLLSIYENEISDKEKSTIISIPLLPKLPPPRQAGRFKKKFARVIATEWDKQNKILTILDEEFPDTACMLHYCVEGVNDIYADTLELTLEEIGLPLVLGLTDIDTTEENQYIPSFIVILPDLLIDVTSIAQAWTSGSDPLSVNVIELFLPSESTEAILTGQVANFFLDELIRDTTLTYPELFTRSFKIYPVEFVRLTDDKIRNMYNQMRSHFDNIRNVIVNRFPSVGIDKNQCVIEPSYFSPQYGIKGRLDLYYQHEEDEGASIVELKSGKPFRPNSYGLSSSNYHQTLLYELLIKSVHGPKHHRANFILYSSSAEQPLRFAVSVESIQKETIQNRNQLVLLQFRMMMLDSKGRNIMEEITPIRYGDLKGYIKTNINNWHRIYSALSPGEKCYFNFFTAYITREHMLARIGSESGEGAGGLAGLWLDKTEIKEECYRILRGLVMTKIDKTAHQTQITFHRGNETNPLANFRAGDIAIMYPYEPRESIDPTKYQLHRANVISVDANEIIIKLRNNQVHTEQIEKVKAWNLEHDLLDSSFKSLYQSLWAFLSSDIGRRQLIFGLHKPPIVQEEKKFPVPIFHLTPTQVKLYNQALNAGPLYLLWGPPGTGKTSRMLKSWVWYYFTHTNARIVLLAYTNKAVDEICDALFDLGKDVSEHFIRIGSKSGSGESFRSRLLDIIIEPLNTRSEIKALLDRTRIFVATVASLQGKSEIFKLINFDIAIIDEASQILEPTMAGLLTRFDKTILIGDHMQLPAVSTQPQQLSRVGAENAWASRIGLTDLGMSYFERIFRLYSSKGWDHVIGILHEQGRMHNDIQEVVNDNIYNQELVCLHPQQQTLPLTHFTHQDDNHLFTERLIYIPASASLDETYLKTNHEEAEIVIDLIASWQRVLEANELRWTIGVITPFRAQIAAILHKAHTCNINMHNVTVDTVERYQGGAKDIVIMSCAVNNHQTLSRIVSLNAEGIDRKLNVAVTRARHQFILVGNESILMKETAYSALVRMSKRIVYHSSPA